MAPGKSKPARVSRAGILDAVDLESIEIDVPEWGGVVRLRAMSAADRVAYEDKLATFDEDGASAGVRVVRGLACLIIATVVDEDDEPLFTDADLDALQEKSFEVLNRVAEAAAGINGMGKIEETEKN